MSTTASTSPFDELGLDVPFAGASEVERFEAGPAWQEPGESPFAEAPADAGAWQERTQGAQTTSESEGLAWLDVEAADGIEDSLSADDFALDSEAPHEHEDESPLDDAMREREPEYLDDEERDASESSGVYAPQEGFEPEDEAVAGSTVPLTAQQRAWILALDRSALESLPDAATRARFLAQDWSDIEFPGNVPKGRSMTDEIRRHWALARALFDAMAGVVPERRVPTTIRFRERPVVSVPGQPAQKLFAEARDAFVRMREAAKTDGVELVILSSWRSRARQAAASANQPNPNAVARKVSTHMYGLAIDLRMGVPGLPIKEMNTRVDRASAAEAGTLAKMGNLVRMYRSPTYKWMALRAREFGWYPYRNEPWHWEYNPPGLKARFEGTTRGELEREGSGDAVESSREQAGESSLYAEAEYDEEAVPSPFLRTFTAKALDVKVAVYVTQAARTARHVEMLVYAHGLDLCKPVSKNRPATFITEAPFKLGELVEASGRPIVLVVPFLDWERLAANGMAFGRKWHRLAKPELFNQVAAEALEHARTIAGNANAPVLQRLILAGHSRAYGFFDALANAYDSPQMRTGALGRPTHVWALDTAYSAPIADWRAWLRSRGDLQATVVFRRGTYRNNGSTVVRELATGIRGREFMKLAASSEGLLTVMPVAADKVSHCAIPNAYLPRLLAGLPAPASSREVDDQALDEGYEEGEDAAGLAAEAAAGDGTQTESEPPIIIADYPRYGMAMPPSFRDLLQPLVATIIKTVRSGGTIGVAVVGHADFDAKGREFETKVSVERATVAQQTLLSMLLPQAELAGIPRDKLLAALTVTIQGMGTKQPRVSNPVNEDQRKKNRRVELSWKASGGKQPPPRPAPAPPRPEDPTVLRVVGVGVWNESSTVHVRGEQLVRFVVRNVDVLPTSIVITDLIHGGKQSRSILPGTTVELEFSMLHRPGPIDWTFGIATNSRTFVVFWQALSFVSSNSQERELEGPEAGEDLAGLAADAAALASDESASGEWGEDLDDETEDVPERFDAFGDERDSEWDSESSEELQDSLEEAELPRSFSLDQQAEGGLVGSGLTPAEQRAVEITSLFETGKRGGFYGLSGNFDGQGLSFGLVNWTIGTGSLQPLLRDFAKEHPARWMWAFGADASRFLQVIAGKDKPAQEAQHRFAIEQMNTVSTNARGKRIWTVRQPWVGYFKRLSEDPAFQKIQVRYVRDLLACAEAYCRRFQLKSEQAFCFMFDAVASHGKGWLRRRFSSVEKRRILVEKALKALNARYGTDRVPESEVLLAVADVLATTSAQRWADKVRQRKRWFVTGQHPRGRELDALRPRVDVPYSTSKATAGEVRHEGADREWWT